jgi:aldose sugar dehydrogenase
LRNINIQNMKKLQSIVTVLLILYLSGCSLTPDRSKRKTSSPLDASMQDSGMIRAASNYANFCASCHWDNLGWFKTRKWKYGNREEDISKSIETGYSDFGMLGYKDTLSEQDINSLAKFIYQKLELKEPESYKPNEGFYLTEEMKIRPDTVIKGLDIPWGLAILPDGDMLVNERSGKMLRYRNGKLVAEIKGVPAVHADGQGGLMDIRLHPDYKTNGWIYFSYSGLPANGENGWNTSVMRARLKDNTLVDKQLLFAGIPPLTTNYHFGCKITFDGKGHVFFGVGERGTMKKVADLSNDWGKVHRLNDDGSIPADNPFVSTPGARKSIWSYGHRNPQGLVVSPFDGSLWESEHGPKGGDELNFIEPGKNYGWPFITFGINYDGKIISPDTAMVGMEQPVIYWVPSFAPCGMTFVTGTKYRNWEGDILIGSLRFHNLVRVKIKNNKVVHQEVLLNNIGRMRNVEMGPDGFIYVSLEAPGMIVRLVPLQD